jgi:cobalt-zinc-cadmium efflux system outer membrane protein
VGQGGQHNQQARRPGWLVPGLAFLAAVLAAASGRAEPVLAAETKPPPLTLEAAIAWALSNNPELAAQRQQAGIAAAGVVIARTYPYNPVYTAKVLGITGPPDAGITNWVEHQHTLMFQLELCGQGRYREQTAQATLSRTEWEIVGQETALAVRVARAFLTVLYRHEKLVLQEETVKLNQEATEGVRKLVEAGKLRGADLILARTEVDDARAQVAVARTALAVAEADLRRALGLVGSPACIQGALDTPDLPCDAMALQVAAQERRAERHARCEAINEARGRLNLVRADRFGTLSIGPAYSINETSVEFIGGQVSVPVPVFNCRKGEIQQREAELQRAMLDMRQVEVQIQQDVEASLARLASARAAVRTYQDEVLPALRTALEGIEKLLIQGEPGVDALRVIDLRRKLLRARNGSLDAQWEVGQASADLSAAVGDPALLVSPAKNLPH